MKKQVLDDYLTTKVMVTSDFHIPFLDMKAYEVMKKYYDFLVLGSGLAGLNFSLKVAEKGKVAIITKSELLDTNTSLAQGGIASVTYAPDDYEKHVQDTLIAGDGLCLCQDLA